MASDIGDLLVGGRVDPPTLTGGTTTVGGWIPDAGQRIPTVVCRAGEADTPSRETCRVHRAGHSPGLRGAGRGRDPGAGHRRERVDAHRRLPGAPALEPVQRRRPLRARPARGQRPGDTVLDRAANGSLRRRHRADEERRPARGLLALQDRALADQRARSRGHRLPDRARLRHLQARPQDRQGERLHEGERQRRERVLADLLEGTARLRPDLLEEAARALRRQGRRELQALGEAARRHPRDADHEVLSGAARALRLAPGLPVALRDDRGAPARPSRCASTSSAATTTSSTSGWSG